MKNYEQIIEEQGWTVQTQLELALEYIDNQKDGQAWLEFLAEKAEEENEATAERDEDPQDWVDDEDGEGDEVPQTFVPEHTVRLIPEIAELVPELIKAGIQIRVSTLFRGAQRLNWVGLEREGNTGVLQYNPFPGYSVFFRVRPNPSYGSSLIVHDDQHHPDVDTLVKWALRATEPQMGNFATNGKIVPNYGNRDHHWRLMSPLSEVKLETDGED